MILLTNRESCELCALIQFSVNSPVFNTSVEPRTRVAQRNCSASCSELCVWLNERISAIRSIVVPVRNTSEWASLANERHIGQIKIVWLVLLHCWANAPEIWITRSGILNSSLVACYAPVMECTSEDATVRAYSLLAISVNPIVCHSVRGECL